MDLSLFLVLLSLCLCTWSLFYKIVCKPYMQMRKLKGQGLRGPPFKVLKGNTKEVAAMLYEEPSAIQDTETHRVLPAVLPHIHKWSQLYGRPFFYFHGTLPHIVISDPEMMKQVLFDKGECFRPPPHVGEWKHLFGESLPGIIGSKWSHRRQMLNPVFHLDNIKSLVSFISSSAQKMADEWEKLHSMEVDVKPRLKSYKADSIARAAFGSTYEEAKSIMDMQSQQWLRTAKVVTSLPIPGSRYLPTRENRKAWKTTTDIRKSLRKMIMERHLKREDESKKMDMDLLDMIIQRQKEIERSKQPGMNMEELVDECKNLYISGAETTTTLLVWTMVVLAMHGEWQERARKEVLELCGTQPPSAQVLNKLKIMEMIMNEVMRLYPPLPLMMRRALRDTEITNASGSKVVRVPAGAAVELSVTMMHHDKEIWGDDVNEFKPERFSNGISKAGNHPMAFIPFSTGPRRCIGMNLALTEAKVVMVTILQRFSFKMSPGYRHSPCYRLSIQPRYGAQIVLTRLA